jgi:flagellar motor switch protein FliN/FliY
MSAAPYYWLEKIKQASMLTQQVPLWGTPPPFPWDACTKTLATSWNMPQLSFAPHKTLWRSYEEMLEGFGSHPTLTVFELTPLKGKAFLAISSQDVAKLTRAGLVSNGEAKGFSDKRLQEGFYQYLVLEGLHAIEQLNPFGDLAIVLAEESPLPLKGALCIDIQGEIQGKPISARLLLSEELCTSFRSHFTQKPHAFSDELLKSLELSLKIEIGTTSLPLSKWKEIQTGDCLLLDRCTFDPKTHKGSAELVLDKIPLFRLRIREEGIKILDYAFYYEEEMTAMDEEDIEDDDDFEDEESEEEEDEDDESEEEEEVDKEKEELLSTEEEKPLWETSSTNEQNVLEKRITANNIPLTITVEIARLKLTVEKLLELKPGNELTLPVRPEQGVDLLINNKKVAKGELIKIGDALGIRILHIGG